MRDCVGLEFYTENVTGVSNEKFFTEVVLLSGFSRSFKNCSRHNAYALSSTNLTESFDLKHQSYHISFHINIISSHCRENATLRFRATS